MNVTERKSSPSAPRVPGERLTVFVVDNDAAIRRSLESLIRGRGWQPAVFASAREFLGLPRTREPSCLILDAILPDLSGLDLQRRVSDRTDMPVIFLTAQTDIQATVRAMKAGALEYLTKPFQHEVLLSAISFALERSQALQTAEAAMRRVGERYASLSRREREVMELVVSGRLNKQIGATLGVAEITVKLHRGNVMRKMLADSVPELVKMATTLGLVTVPCVPGALLRSVVSYPADLNRSGRLSAVLASAGA